MVEIIMATFYRMQLGEHFIFYNASKVQCYVAASINIIFSPSTIIFIM